MKSRNSRILLLLVLTGIVAWNTPSSDDLIMGSGNDVLSVTGQMGVIGNNNKATGTSVLILGDSNEVSYGAAASDVAKYSLIVGQNNLLSEASGGRRRNIIGGDSNSVNGTNCLVTGFSNTIKPSLTGSSSSQSAAIGSSNEVFSDRGWAIGQFNAANGYRSIAMGIGAEANNAESLAIGRYNETMETDDVVVIGAGSSGSTRKTVLRATANGNVILGNSTAGSVLLAKAQGDISMGIYGN